MDLDRLPMELEGELLVKTRPPLLPGGIEGELGGEARAHEQSIHAGEIGGVDQNIKVAEAAQGEIAVGLDGKGGAFDGEVGNAQLREEANQMQQGGDQVQIAISVGLV